MPIHYIKNNGNSGELSPNFDARTDHIKYYNGWTTASNVLPAAQGGMTKRSGSKFLVKAKGDCKLIKFNFSPDDKLCLEVGYSSAGYIRFLKDNDRVMNDVVTVVNITLSGTDPVSIEATSHGYSTGDIVRFYEIIGIASELVYSFDNHNEYTITKTNDNNFTLDGTDSSDFTTGTFTSGTCKSVYEITSPYGDGEHFEIHYVPSGDTIYIAHPDYFPRELIRTSDNNWSISEIDFDMLPFLTQNTDTTKTMTCVCGTHTGSNNASVLTDSTQSWTVDGLIGYSVKNLTDGCTGVITDNTATTITIGGGLDGGSDNDFDTNDTYVILDGYYIPVGVKVTLTASGHTPFVVTSDIYNGSRWSLKHTRSDNTTSTPDNSTNVAPTGNGILIKGYFTFEVTTFASGNIAKLWRKEPGGSWQEERSFQAATSYSGQELLDDVYYAFTISAGATIVATLTAKEQVNIGVVKINSTAYTSSVAICDIEKPVYFDPSGSNNTTSMWSESAWNGYRGYPKTVTIHNNRLVWAGTANNPKNIWFSRTGKYKDHTIGIAANDSIDIYINEGNASSIQWMASYKGLLVGTSNSEYLISAADINNPITPTDKKSVIQSSVGSNNIQPIILINDVFFSQRNGKKLRLLKFNDYGDRLVNNDMTLFSNHMFNSPPVCMDIQTVPESFLLVVRADGTLTTFLHEPTEEISPWTRWVTGSLLDSPVDKYTSVAVLDGTTEDNILVSVNRTINDVSVYYIELFGDRYIEYEDDALMLDSAKVVSGEGTSQNIILASDTVRFGSGIFGSSYFGGTV